MDHKAVFCTGIFLALLMAVTDTEKGSVRHYYYFFNTPKTWSEAQSFCRAKKIDLATIDNMQEQRMLMASYTEGDIFWIGLKRSSTALWVWSEGIGVVTLYGWNPSTVNGDCVWRSPEGHWFTDSCGSRRLFVCLAYDQNGNESFILQTEPMSWRNAQSYCRKHYTDLVSTNTMATHQEMSVISKSNNIWIGLFRDTWMWSDRSTSSFRYWDSTNPDDYGGIQDCGALRMEYQMQWDDANCNNRYSFVCCSDREVKNTAVVKVKIQVPSGVNLNDPSVSDSLLQQFQAHLDKQGLSGVKIRWRVRRNEQIFHVTPENSGTKQNRLLHGEDLEE